MIKELQGAWAEAPNPFTNSHEGHHLLKGAGAYKDFRLFL
jgi:hypothetical protein